MFRKTLISVCVCTMLAWCAAGVARAQELRSDRATYFTFSQPVTLPGVTLPAGKYLFRLADSAVNRTIVQVFNADGSKLHAMFLTIPASRSEASDDPEIRFYESPQTVPFAIASWWYPGMTTGWEFIYPREQAGTIAKNSTTPVLTTAQAESVTTDQMKTADLARVTSTGEQKPAAADANPPASKLSGTAQRGEVASTRPAPAAQPPAPSTRPAPPTPAAPPAPSTPPAAAVPTPAPPPATTTPAPAPASPAPAAKPQGATSPSPATDPAPARTRLPETAGVMPVVGLIGALALCAGFGLGLWRRRSA